MKGRLKGGLSGRAFLSRLDFLLEKRGKRRKDLSSHLGLTESTISSWGTRDFVPPVGVCAMISGYLDVSLDYLVFGETRGKESCQDDLLLKAVDDLVEAAELVRALAGKKK